MKIEELESIKGLEILLVDDNAINRLLLTNMLNIFEIRVQAAENGAKAIEKLSKDKYDAVLMDIQMPGMDGYQATSAIRAKEGEYFRNLPIFAMANNPDPGKIESCGMNGYIQAKPFDRQKLLDVLSSFLKK